MHVLVQIPASLRQFSDGERLVRLDFSAATTVRAVFQQLHVCHPGVVERALDEQGNVREHVNVFVDGESIRAGPKRGLETPVSAGAEVWILPAVSGGSLSLRDTMSTVETLERGDARRLQPQRLYRWRVFS